MDQEIDFKPLARELLAEPTTAKLKQLLSAGLNLQSHERLGETFFLRFVREAPDVTLLNALQDAGAEVQAKTPHGFTALHYAAWLNPQVSVTEWLLAKGCPVNARTDERTGFCTPLMLAAKNNRSVEVLRRLLAGGAEVNNIGSAGTPPLVLAAEFNPNPEVALELLAAGADPNGRDQAGFSALRQALCCTSGHAPSLKLVQALMKAGADLHWHDEDGATLLSVAIEDYQFRHNAGMEYDREILWLLLDAGIRTRWYPPAPHTGSSTVEMRLSDEEVKALLDSLKEPEL